MAEPKTESEITIPIFLRIFVRECHAKHPLGKIRRIHEKKPGRFL
jgi:hypothetical protein